MGEPSRPHPHPQPPPLTPTDDIPSPLSLSIRFAIALPDLPLFVPHAATTAVSTLKRQLREALPAEHARRRLRLIYGGRVLSDAATIASQVSVPRAPPRGKEKGKGKEVVGADGGGEGAGGGGGAGAGGGVVYIHCSVGDELSDLELAEERDNKEPPPLPSHTTLPQPLGFDRLLSAGFSELDVASLRSQFSRLHPLNDTTDDDPTHAHTTRLLLEDRWIDEGATASASAAADGGGSYEDMFVGTAIGFFWPVAIFLLREEGVFSKRRGMAVVAGVLVNLAFSVLRVSS